MSVHGHFIAKLVLIFLVAGVVSISVFSTIVSLVLVNASMKRPAGGWPAPGKSGSRVQFADRISASEAWFLSQKPEDVGIVSYDGLKLSGRFLPAADRDAAKGTVLLMHGYHTDALYEFAGIYDFFHREKYNVLLCDQRAHGKSGGTYLTFGIRERYDCRSWIRYLNGRLGEEKPLWLMGVSMGSSTVLMASGFDLPGNIRGIIADCGYTSPYDIIKLVLVRNYHLPAPIILPYADIVTHLTAGFGLKEYSTLQALKTNRIPVLFIHGDNDTFVPFEMSKQNYTACTAPKLFLETHADHAASFLFASEQYEAVLEKFMS